MVDQSDEFWQSYMTCRFCGLSHKRNDCEGSIRDNDTTGLRIARFWAKKAFPEYDCKKELEYGLRE